MTGRLLLAGALAVSLSACDDGAPVQRGFGSRQLVQLRDPNFYFRGSRGDIVLYSFGADPERFLSVDLRTGAIATHDLNYSDVPVPEYTYPADPNARYHCSYGLDATKNLEFLIDDAQTGTTTTIAGGVLTADCPTDADPTLRIWRRDDAGHVSLWTGRYDDLQMAPVDLNVINILQALRSTDAAVSVLAARPAQPDAFGIYSIDLTTFVVTELIPPALTSGAWADGATPAGGVESASIFLDKSQLLNGVLLLGDRFAYWRVMADGSAPTLFVGPLASGPARELALFNQAVPAPDRRYVGPAEETSGPVANVPPMWQMSNGTGSSDLLIWDDARLRLQTCATAFDLQATGMVSSDRSKLAAFAWQDPNTDLPSSLRTGPLLLVDLANPAGGPAACATVVAGDVSIAGLSPDGSSLFWMSQHPPSMFGELWLAAADGSAARLIGADSIEGPPHAPHFVGPSQLEIDIKADLVWIDTHDPATKTNAIAEEVLGGAIDRGRWLITGYDASVQDGTATLGIVNRDTGDKRVISPAVVKFFSPDIDDRYGTAIVPSPFRTAADGIRIVYLVQGRNPSAQDGLWVATINPSDIP
jgi:hypothetical protein